MLEHYLESGEVEEADIVKMVAQRKVFPCYFGSALKEEGVDKFLKGVETYTAERKYGDKFAARVFKIARDAQGNRLTYLKVTGGVLKVMLPKVKIAMQRRRRSGKKRSTRSAFIPGHVMRW